jgi:predicted DNA binding CopG/RHH family protein
MKKRNNSKHISPETALEFLENMRTLSSKIDTEKKMISIRIPQNLLEAIKLKAQVENKKYQSLIVESIRRYLSE